MRELSNAQLNTTAFLPPPVNTIDAQLPPTGKTYKFFKMYEDSGNVRMFIDIGKGIMEFLIPATHVKIVKYANSVLVDEPKKTT